MNLTAYLIITTLLDTGPVAFLMFYLYRNRLRCSKRLAALLLAGKCFAIIALTLYTFQPGFAHGWLRLTYSFLALLFSYAVYLALFNGTARQILFTMLVVKGYRDDVAFFVDVLRDYAKHPTLSRDSLVLYTILTSLLLLVTVPLMCLFLDKCVRPVAEVDGSFPFWRYLWAIPASFYFLYRLGVSPNYLDVMGTLKGMFLLPYIWTLSTLLTYFVILRMLSEMVRNARLEERLHISELQMSMQRELYESLRASIEDTRRLRHDIRHHLAALKGYVDKDDCDGAGRYLDSFLNDFRTEERLCENYAADAIARHFVTAAKAAGVTVETALRLPQPLSAAESDVCVVLGNLLENAVEACARQESGPKHLAVKAGIVGRSMIAISVRNSYSGEVRRAGEAFLSSKRNGEGIGINSVRAVAAQYRGTAKFEYGDGVFCASVLLNP